mmetsp:Transcript_22731/g.49023  ORF Transcript_22731/g.49023 Transcript_22731/m.49023 type:complete len:311 (-) Transcript_22731:1478-2410(-)
MQAERRESPRKVVAWEVRTWMRALSARPRGDGRLRRRRPSVSQPRRRALVNLGLLPDRTLRLTTGRARGATAAAALGSAGDVCAFFFFCRFSSPATAIALRLPSWGGARRSADLAERAVLLAEASLTAASAWASPSAAAFSNSSIRCSARRRTRLMPAYLSRLTLGLGGSDLSSLASASASFRLAAAVGLAHADSLAAARSEGVWNQERAGRAMIRSWCSMRLEALLASISATRSSFSSRSSARRSETCPSTSEICSIQKEMDSCATTRVCTVEEACLRTRLRKARSPSPTSEMARPASPARAVRPTRWT